MLVGNNDSAANIETVTEMLANCFSAQLTDKVALRPDALEYDSL